MVLLQQQMKRSSGTASQAKLLPNGRVAYGGGVYFSNCKSRVFNFADKHEDPAEFNGQSLAATRTGLDSSLDPNLGSQQSFWCCNTTYLPLRTLG